MMASVLKQEGFQCRIGGNMLHPLQALIGREAVQCMTSQVQGYPVEQAPVIPARRGYRLGAVDGPGVGVLTENPALQSDGSIHLPGEFRL